MRIKNLDVRTLPTVKRHSVLLNLFRNLPAGESFEFVNDRNPKQLYNELCALFGNVVEWEYLKSGPKEWRVRVMKAEYINERNEMNVMDKTDYQTDTKKTTVVKEFDVRNHPCIERHDMVFGAFDELKTGESFVFTNDHDPRPLYHKLKMKYSEPVMWEYLQSLPGEWIIKVSKT